MQVTRLAALLGICLGAYAALAQESVQEISPTSKPAPPEEREWWKQERLLGSMGGARTALAEKGISFNIDVMQVLQQNAYGGKSTNDGLRYMGKGDLTLTIDTGKLGLWEGGVILLNAEPRWGKGVNRKVGSLLPVNLNAVKPTIDDDCEIALSEWIYFQHLFNNKLVLIAGKLDGSRAFDRNEFANDERTQFMNLGLRNNPIIPAFLPYTNLGVGAVVNPTDWLSIVTAVADSQGKASTTGFNTAFHGPTHTTVINEVDFKVKPFGKPGNQRIGWVWSSKEFEHLQPPFPLSLGGSTMISLLGPKLANQAAHAASRFGTSPDNIGIYYNFDQYLWTEECDPKQGVGVFGRFGWAREDVNPVNYFYSLGLGGKGVIPDRDKDTFGIGYYHVDLSNDMPPVFAQEAGIEMYYDIEVLPWLHIAPDVQVVVDPGGMPKNECSFVYGFRMRVNL